MPRLRVLFLCLPLFAAACEGDIVDLLTPTSTVPFSTTDLRVGLGTVATSGRTITVNYTGWLYSSAAVDNRGAQFDTSAGRGPYQFVLGAGTVIAGWESGVIGMRVGGVRKVVIPPNLAYGEAGSPPAIPGNATLVFDIELLNVE